MPEVVIFLAAGRTVEQKRGLMRDITDAVVRNLDTPAENVVVSIMETALENKARGGVTFAERRARPGKAGT